MLWISKRETQCEIVVWFFTKYLTSLWFLEIHSKINWLSALQSTSVTDYIWKVSTCIFHQGCVKLRSVSLIKSQLPEGLQSLICNPTESQKAVLWPSLPMILWNFLACTAVLSIFRNCCLFAGNTEFIFLDEVDSTGKRFQIFIFIIISLNLIVFNFLQFHYSWAPPLTFYISDFPLFL